MCLNCVERIGSLSVPLCLDDIGDSCFTCVLTLFEKNLARKPVEYSLPLPIKLDLFLNTIDHLGHLQINSPKLLFLEVSNLLEPLHNKAKSRELAWSV